MWNLRDEGKYKKLFNFETDKIYTWGKGKNDKQSDPEKRKEIREKAIDAGISQVPKNKSYAFRISIYIDPNRKHELDIDNTVKLIVDSFSQGRVSEDVSKDNSKSKDSSKHLDCWLYKDDSYPNVKVIEVGVVKEVDPNNGEKEKMLVKIFECL